MRTKVCYESKGKKFVASSPLFLECSVDTLEKALKTWVERVASGGIEKLTITIYGDSK